MVAIEEVKHFLRELLDRKRRCMDPDLIAVNNGIFNYRTKVLEPFKSNKVFLTKSRVDYNPNAKNVVIHNPDDNTDDVPAQHPGWGRARNRGPSDADKGVCRRSPSALQKRMAPEQPLAAPRPYPILLNASASIAPSIQKLYS